MSILLLPEDLVWSPLLSSREDTALTRTANSFSRTNDEYGHDSTKGRCADLEKQPMSYEYNNIYMSMSGNGTVMVEWGDKWEGETTKHHIWRTEGAMQTIALSAIFCGGCGPQNMSELKHCHERGIVGKVGVGRTTWPPEDDEEDEALGTGGTGVGITYFGDSLSCDGTSLAEDDDEEDSFSCVDIVVYTKSWRKCLK